MHDVMHCKLLSLHCSEQDGSVICVPVMEQQFSMHDCNSWLQPIKHCSMVATFWLLTCDADHVISKSIIVTRTSLGSRENLIGRVIFQEQVARKKCYESFYNMVNLWSLYEGVRDCQLFAKGLSQRLVSLHSGSMTCMLQLIPIPLPSSVCICISLSIWALPSDISILYAQKKVM